MGKKMSKPKVAIVKVKKEDVEAAVREAIELLGGIKQFVADFKEILLKPNLLSAPKEKHLREKIRTDPRILDAISKMLLELNKKVLIADSCSAGHQGGTRRALKYSGYLEIGEKDENITVRSLEQNGPLTIDIKGKKLGKICISKDFLEAEAVINVPKMKTHSMTVYTGAIKNLYGTITGGEKTRIHSLGGNLQGFSQCLVDIYSFEKPKIKLNVMDAIIAAEGMGPGASSDPVEMNLILASSDTLALDAVAFSLMGHDPAIVPTLKYAAEQGLGTININEIEILGEKLETQKKTFKLPKTGLVSRIPFQKLANIILKVPKYQSGCIGCRDCERGCPEEVITVSKNNNGNWEPKIDYKGCISCFTCIEVCPESCYTFESRNLKRTIIYSSLIVMMIVIIVTTLAILL
jgi:uncharacterized protein (DUF362 family)/Pyruvate/2-oxoacid:ferredoxin oxidoreductase delta subunit